MFKKTDRIGEDSCNTFGTLMRIVEYKDTHNELYNALYSYKVEISD